MMEFLFQVTLLASIRAEAVTQAEAELKLRSALEASGANPRDGHSGARPR